MDWVRPPPPIGQKQFFFMPPLIGLSLNDAQAADLTMSEVKTCLLVKPGANVSSVSPLLQQTVSQMS